MCDKRCVFNFKEFWFIKGKMVLSFSEVYVVVVFWIGFVSGVLVIIIDVSICVFICDIDEFVIDVGFEICG